MAGSGDGVYADHAQPPILGNHVAEVVAGVLAAAGQARVDVRDDLDDRELVLGGVALHVVHQQGDEAAVLLGHQRLLPARFGLAPDAVRAVVQVQHLDQQAIARAELDLPHPQGEIIAILEWVAILAVERGDGRAFGIVEAHLVHLGGDEGRQEAGQQRAHLDVAGRGCAAERGAVQHVAERRDVAIAQVHGQAMAMHLRGDGQARLLRAGRQILLHQQHHVIHVRGLVHLAQHVADGILKRLFGGHDHSSRRA